MMSVVLSRWSRRGCAAVIAAVLWAPPAAAQDATTAPLLLPVPKRLAPNQGEYVMMRAPGGGYVYDDFRFQARVAPDGHVTFSDKHIRLETRVFGVPTERYRRAGDARPSLVQAIEQVLRNDPDRPVSPMLEVCQQRVDMMLPGLAPCIMAATPITITGTFDLTDELMRATGQGWYKYEKAKFLSATFDFRVRLAAARHAKLLREAIADIPDRLEGLWRDASFTPRERRRIMCLLWAEVNVADPASRRAAEAMERWIRHKLPEGSAEAFTAGERAACAGESRRSFDPYNRDPYNRDPYNRDPHGLD